MSRPRIETLQGRRYFTEQDARALIGLRVQARVALSRHWLRDLGLWIGAGGQGTVTQFAFGPEPAGGSALE